MSLYNNICLVHLIMYIFVQCDILKSYIVIAFISAIYGLILIMCSIVGSIIMNASQYEQTETDICFGTFLFNFLMVVYTALYGILALYNTNAILRTKNMRWTFYIKSLFSLGLIFFGFYDYNEINNCTSDYNSVMYYKITFWYNLNEFFVSSIMCICGYVISKNNQHYIFNEDPVQNNYLYNV